jgi:Flp pilus assembly protein TadG
MGRSVRTLFNDQRGAIAPTVALALVGLIAVGGLAFDYARLGTMDTELQQAADQAALAAATQLDGKSGAITRADAAARNLVVNRTSFANDAGTATVGGLTMTYYDSYDQSADSFGTVTTDPLKAKVVKVEVGGRTAKYAMTPIIGLITGQTVVAQAVASVGNAICKTPPVMLCNPVEPSSNTNKELAFAPTPGTGLRLITGDATVPGNFGWLESGLASGATALASALGYNSPPGDCLPETGVTTKPGMTSSVLSAYNTRFDVYDNGNSTCPSQYGGICSPAINTRKDLVCDPNGGGTGCKNDAFKWPDTSYYHLPVIAGTVTQQALPVDGSQDPKTMGYPHDYCHAWPISQQTCTGNKVAGNGSWDRDAYFRVNYKLNNAQWTALPGMPATPSRYDVYKWELTHGSNASGGTNYGVSVPQIVNANTAAFSYPANGRPGVAESTSQGDRRKISVAVVNCYALNVKGSASGVPVTTWMDVFLTEPAIDRTEKGGGKAQYTDQKDIYVEMIKATTASSAVAGAVVRRDKPFLIR